jgi:uncharacterized lipoprotein YddW (UPF0748 family)
MLPFILMLASFLSAQATPGGSDLVPASSQGQMQEMRGIWVTRWSWETPEDVRRILREVKKGGFNTVYFQVRGSFDAFYRSDIEPWGARLTGSLGGDPGWDPLALAVEEAHVLGLELHAYLNVFPFWKSGEALPPATDPPHAIRTHPGWEVQDGQGRSLLSKEQPYHFASPGNPDVRFRVAQVAADIDARYAVDGIHLDYIRYPHKSTSHDPVSTFRGAQSGVPWPEWQRDQVIATVAAVSARVDTPVTAAVWGVNENRWGWEGVSQGKHDFYQDSHAFLARGVLDAIAPMIYWPVTAKRGQRLDFSTLVADHVAHRSGRHVYAGISAALDYEQILSCIAAARKFGAQGVIIFDYSQIKPHLAALKRDAFSQEAAVPTMEWR